MAFMSVVPSKAQVRSIKRFDTRLNLMRISRLSVHGLFGLFDHSVPINLEEHVTIIHGANGLGKTALLRLLDGFFNARSSELETIPFDSFEIEFDNNSRLEVRKAAPQPKKGAKRRQKNGLVFSLFSEGSKTEHYNFAPERSSISSVERRQIERYLSLEQIGSDEWRYLTTGETLSLREVVTRFGDEFPFGEIWKEPEPEWLVELRKAINVHFIQTQRLFSFTERRPPQRSMAHLRESPVVTPYVQVYAEEVTHNISSTLSQYAELSQSLDRTFPQRLVQQKDAQPLSTDELRGKLLALEQKRQRLRSAGLLEEESNAQFGMPEQLELDATTQKVLSVYVDDVEKKLSVFDSLANKIDLLKQISDDHFIYKRMVMNRDRGFGFIGHDGQPLSPTQLSSGEQHQLVLLYELLFKVKPGSLILIDEPEISLHVAWQQQFLKDLTQIIQLSHFDVLIATHSPQVIHDRWDLTVELQGPPQSNETRK